ncbi:MAG: hypothetical protein AAF597_08920 [Bacteroidota bacterium]
MFATLMTLTAATAPPAAEAVTYDFISRSDNANLASLTFAGSAPFTLQNVTSFAFTAAGAAFFNATTGVVPVTFDRLLNDKSIIQHSAPFNGLRGDNGVAEISSDDENFIARPGVDIIALLFGPFASDPDSIFIQTDYRSRFSTFKSVNGDWKLSVIPLPASALFLVSAFALSGLYRRLRS